MQDVYCVSKFNYLKVDTDHRLAYNCHAAMPHHIDVEWLKENPGRIFNTALMHQEREQMLQGIKNKSCYYQCYKAEDLGQMSVRSRTDQSSPITEIDSQPTTLDIALGSDCNLTCVYCQADFSSSWRRDLNNNGEYDIKDSDNWENYLKSSVKVLNKLSQKQKRNREFMDVFINEIKLMKKNLKRLIITGGEPFLNNDLSEILKICEDVPKVMISTGLGVSESRFKKIIQTLSKLPNVYLQISNETMNEYHEFNRYGSTWRDFEHKLKLLKENDISFRFHGTISNTVLLDLHNFLNYCSEKNYRFGFVPIVYPDFLRLHVLDDVSKERIKAQLKKFDNLYQIKDLLGSIDNVPSVQERRNCAVYLKEFAKRRKQDLNLFPKEFIEWLDKAE